MQLAMHRDATAGGSAGSEEADRQAELQADSGGHCRPIQGEHLPAGHATDTATAAADADAAAAATILLPPANYATVATIAYGRTPTHRVTAHVEDQGPCSINLPCILPAVVLGHHRLRSTVASLCGPTG